MDGNAEPDLPLTELEWEESFSREQHRIIPFSAIAQGAIHKPPPLIEGILLDRTITMVSAEPYCGKTMFTLALAFSLATSLQFLDSFTVPAVRPVLFMGQDAPSWDYAEQVRKLYRGMGLTTRGEAELPLDMSLNRGLTILDAKFFPMLQAWHDSTGFGLLILDTLASFHHFDENDSRAMGMVMGMLKHIRDTFSCAVIFTHHTSKPPTGPGPERSLNYAARGSTVIAGSIDLHYAMRRPLNAQGDVINVYLPKGRGLDALSGLTHFTIEDVKCAEGPAVKLKGGGK